MKANAWKLVIIAAVLAWALFQAFPRADRPFLNMKLGLDLKGGSHLVMQVVTDDAVKAQCDLEATRVADKLRKDGFADVRAIAGETIGEVVITGIPAARLAEAEKTIATQAPSWTTASDGATVKLRMPLNEQESYRDQAVKQALQTIDNRVNAFGVGETNIQRLGGSQRDRILVELPGVEDPSRVKRVLQTQARLELRSAYYTPDGQGPFRGLTREDVLAQFGGRLPAGVDVLPLEAKQRASALADGQPADQQAPAKIQEWYAVETTSVVTGADLADARPATDQWGQTVVSFSLRVGAADRFGRFTREHINKIMPIVLDDRIKSAPVIRAEISSSGQIEGNFDRPEAEDLALVLRAGALPARVVTLEERTVGPSLGKDSIDAGWRASLYAFIAVFIFMVGYYKLAGLNAEVVLLMNLLILAAIMSSFGAVLTLPGIGGYALTVGMAVDANVLIFERIREELRAGKTVKGALDAGFSKALHAILDTHVTTIVAALLLFNFGTGAVKGFAVSLGFGLLANLFTAVFVSRVMFDLIYGDRPVRTISI